MKKDKVICVIGLGYIGLPTACFLANAGYKVIGFDLNEEKVNLLKNKKLPFQEFGLSELLKKAVKNMSFSKKIVPADVFIISVPTPVENEKADLKYVEQASQDINKVLKDGNLVVLESTVPPGTSEEIVLPILKKGHKNYRIYISHAPERAIPGSTLREMTENDRVIGGVDQESTILTKNIYSSFVKGKIHLTNSTTAEFIKLIENTFRDVNIAFANELAKMCEDLGINVWEAIKLANLHPRVNIHMPGPGVGGHCISVDPWFLVNKNVNGTEMIKLAREINDAMPFKIIEYVSKIIGNIKNPTVTILGVAYKADVDDWRETPALKIIESAKNRNWQIKIHDPLVSDFPYAIEKEFKKAVKNSDCLVLVANHKFYKEINPNEINNMRNKYIFDSRNFIDEKKWKEAGFLVKILGKK